jgi:hypothetical protein
MTRLRDTITAAALAALLAACATGATGWRDRLTLLPTTGDRVLGERLIDAQYVVAGRLIGIHRASVYEPHGGWLMRALFHDAGSPDAYEAKIVVDSVLVGGSQPKHLFVTFFAPEGNRIPTVGKSAIWIAHRRQLWRLSQASSYGTPSDIGLALDSDDDVRPMDEWSQLRTVAQKLRLSSVW